MQQPRFLREMLLKHHMREMNITTYAARSFHATRMTRNTSVAWESAKPFAEIPSFRMLPFIGTAWTAMPLIGRYRLDRQQLANHDKRKRLGDIIHERFGSFDAVVCFSAKDLETLVRNEGSHPYRIEFETLKVYRESRKKWFSTTGLLVLQGKQWYSLRSKTQKHLLKHTAVNAYTEPLQEVARDLVQRIFEIRDANKEVPDVLQELFKWALESVSLVGLDTRLGCLRSNLPPDSDGVRMIESVATQFHCMNKLEAFLGNLQWWKIFPSPTWKKFERASDIYAEISFKYINKALDAIKNSKGDESKLTLLQAMLVNKDLTVSDAMVFVADMLMAGIETTSYTAGFLLYHLAKHPEKQQHLFEEIIKLLPNKDSKLTPAIYENMSYAKACIKEALRLNPVIPGTARILASDVVLSGYKVPAGTMVFVPFDEVFGDEKYFKNPKEFMPERWLSRDEKHNPFAFMPFGFGVRSCIGRRVAELELVNLATEIVRNFKVAYHFEDIGVYSKMVNVPDKPLRFNFIER